MLQMLSQTENLRLSRRWINIILASVGSGIEFYDFVVYAIFSHSIAVTFFPANDVLVSLIATYTVFAVSFLVRPVGGLVLSLYVDRYGRQPVLMASLLCISLCALSMALLPSYATGGAAASITFIGFRLLQSACFGGEVGNAITYVVEINPRKAGAACGILFGMLGAGVIIGTGINLVLTYLMPTELLSLYGWRLAFFLGGVLGLVSFSFRGRIAESPAFDQSRAGSPRITLRTLWRLHRRSLFVGFGLCAATGAGNGFIFAYLATFLGRSGGYGSSGSAMLVMSASICLCVVTPLIGWASDHCSWIWLHRLGCFSLISLSWPLLFLLSSYPSRPYAILPVLGLAASVAVVNGSLGQLLASLFPVQVRASGVTLSYNLAMGVFQALTPLTCIMLLKHTGIPSVPAAWIIATAGIALLSGLLYKSSSATLGSVLR